MSLLFCNISWMREYQGRIRIDGEPNDLPQRGGRWVEENGTAGECCNFLPDENGTVYGHVETWRGDEDGSDCQIAIEKLGANKKSKYVDGIDVIWIATHENGGRRVVGWYQNARVYRYRQGFKVLPTKQHKKDGIGSYRITAESENVYLIPENERNLKLGKGQHWPGKNSQFYPDKHRNDNQELETFIQQLQKYINTKLVEKTANNKELKELLEDLNAIENQEGITTTEKQRLITARVGQGWFREQLRRLWQGCAVTQCNKISILRASHIKPWRDSNNNERLNVYNGLLLTPNLDILFDKGFISFEDNGKIIISKQISSENMTKLGVNPNMKILVHKKHIRFLKWHRENMLKK